jgi:hypothetical protein
MEGSFTIQLSGRGQRAQKQGAQADSQGLALLCHRSENSRMARPPDPRLVEFLSAYDASVSKLALKLRALVLEEAPEAVEAIYDAYNAVALGFSFTGKFKDSFIHIATYTKHVNLGFNRGATLPDPHKVLLGTGNQIRHIKIASEQDLKKPYLRDYIRAAVGQFEKPSGLPDLPESVVRGNYPVKRRPAKA